MARSPTCFEASMMDLANSMTRRALSPASCSSPMVEKPPSSLDRIPQAAM